MNTKVTSTALRNEKRLGGWLPRNEAALAAFRTKLADHVKTHRKDVTWFPVIQDLAKLIDDDPVLRMGLTQAIDQAIADERDLGYSTIEELMNHINHVMTYAPPFGTTGLVGCPLNALLDWPMCMPAGFALFRSSALNAQLKRVLNFWCDFLSGPDSRTYLNDTSPDGWFCPEALDRIPMSEFIHDPDEPFWGFTSWNDFFTREFKPGARPVSFPDDDKVIINACEATPHNVQKNVKLQDSFWVKSPPYSLLDIFTPSRRQFAESYVGGSIYQAFLSAYNYHRWHAPVRGTILDAYVVDGTYYADSPSEGRDSAGPDKSQSYITAVATRAVIIIQCDDLALGNVACVFVGMAEISSCVIEKMPGQHVEKGDELGYFQFGGSTHCLIFQPGVIQSFVPQPPFDPDAPPIEINTQIATAN